MRPNHHRWLAVSTAACALSLVLGSACSQEQDPVADQVAAVHDIGVFELEADALDDGLIPGDDWDTVLLGGGGSSIATTGVLADPAGTTIFRGGGSKDHRDIDMWGHSSGSAPDKDEITNAYAAAYDVGGDLVIYFGADRFANNGDAQLGFWFFQENVTAEPDGSFDGLHQIGDILVLAHFSQGGGVPTIEVFEWVGTGGSEHGGTLDLLASATAECGASAGDDICAITNSSPTSSPWPYTPKGGALGDDFPAVSFFEGGINLSEIFAGSTLPCFASFMAESRSSTSVQAVLKDFVLGAFPVCGIDITKSCTDGDINATEDGFVYTYSGTVTNTGFGTLYDVTVDDQGTIFDLGDIPAGGTAPFGGTFESTLNPATNSASVSASTSSGGPQTVTDSVGPVTCPAVDRDPAISVTKSCTTRLEVVGDNVVVVVDFMGQVCNDTSGTGAVGLTDVVVVDDGGTPADPADDQTFNVGALPADTCVSWGMGSYYPGSTNSTNPLSAEYSDTVTATGDAVLGFGSVGPETASATCALCPPPTP